MSDFRHSLEIVKDSMQSCFDESILLSNQLYLNKKVYDLLNTFHGDKMEYINISQDIGSMVSGFNINESIQSTYIYCSNMNLYESEVVKKLDSWVKDAVWYKVFTESDHDILFYQYIDNARTGEFQKHISLIRKLDYFRNYKADIILRIDLDISKIEKVLKQQAFSGKMYLVDNHGNIIISGDSDYNSVNPSAFKNISEMADIDNGSIISEELIFPSGWKVVLAIDQNDIREIFYNKETVNAIILIIINMIIATSIISIMTKSFVRKLSLLTECTYKMQSQRFELIDEKEAGNDEIGVLIRGMNEAVITIKDLLEKIELARIRNNEIYKEKKRAEFNALQSQINPHFMFNMLEVIRMKSVVKQEVETARIIKYISNMFRRIITWGDDIITVQNELEFVNFYLEVQKYRFDDEVTIDLSVDESVLLYKIPKMTVQVFVENAFVHGLSDIVGQKIFRLSITKDDNRIKFVIIDNGVGMDKKTINEILESINSNEDKTYTSKKIGIHNVMKRIKLYYGEDYDFEITSIPNQMTKVTLSLGTADNFRLESEV